MSMLCFSYEFTHVNPFELPVEEKVKSVIVDPEKEYDNIMSRVCMLIVKLVVFSCAFT